MKCAWGTIKAGAPGAAQGKHTAIAKYKNCAASTRKSGLRARFRWNCKATLTLSRRT